MSRDQIHGDVNCAIRKLVQPIICDIRNGIHSVDDGNNKSVDHRKNFSGWLERGVQARGKRKALALALGVDQARITEMIKGDRTIKAEELPVIVSVIGESPPGLGIARTLAPALIAVRGRAGIGWQEAQPFIESSDPNSSVHKELHVPISAVPNERYIGLNQFAVQNFGQAMNLVIPDGFFAICVPYDQVRERITDGDLVLAQRQRGNEYEGIIRRVRRTQNGWHLACESSDALSQKTISLESTALRTKEIGSDTESIIEIVGLVIWVGKPV